VFFSSRKIYSITSTIYIIIILLDFLPAYSTRENSEASTNTTGSFWSEGVAMPTPRTELLADAINEKIYVIAGVDYSEDGAGQLDIVEVYDTQNDTWIGNAKPLPIPIDHSVAIQYEGKIYVVGGFLEQKAPTDTLFIYDPTRDEWTEGARLPSPRGALAAEFVNGTLYAFGGLDSSQIPVNTNWAYNPKTDTWTERAPMPTARHHVASAVVDGKIYAIGGRILGNGVPSEDIDEAVSNFDKNEMYDPSTDTWTVKQPMQDKRSGFAAAAANGQIYVFGGQDVGGIFNSVEKYDPSSNKWTYEQPMPSARMGMGAVTIDGKIYLIGGQIGGRDSITTKEVLDINSDIQS
jgi:N-acetylneuraminic acid mutarotase